MNTEKGFSLIELITTMVVIAVLITIAVISARDWTNRYKIQSQVKQLHADLLNARVSAMQRNRTFFVVLSANQYSIYEDSYPPPDGNAVLDTGAGQDRLVIQTATQYGMNFTSANLSFDRSGLVSLSSGTIGTISLVYPADLQPLADCIALSSTRVGMGKMNGTTCTVQ